METSSQILLDTSQRKLVVYKVCTACYIILKYM